MGILFRFARSIAKCFVIAILVVIAMKLALAALGLRTWSISGLSMLPTLQDESVSITCSWTPIDRGDIVTIESPLKEGEFWVKRVIGIPGDRIFTSGNYLEANGEPDLISIKLGYSNSVVQKETSLVLLEDEYFVAGDNRSVSYDSRFVGPIKEDAIVSEQLINF